MATFFEDDRTKQQSVSPSISALDASSNNDVEADQSFILSNQTGISQSRSCATQNNDSVLYGVDWSGSAHPTSHCWFPLLDGSSSSTKSCAYVSCSNPKSTLLQCGSCTLVAHSVHFDHSQMSTTDSLPPCRPSFVDDDQDPSKYDQHVWSHTSRLPQPCAHCRRISVSKNLFSKSLGIPPFNVVDQMTAVVNTSESSAGLLCLWCSTGYHRSCWESVAQESKNLCDYGIFRKIIVRPQWLHRCSESLTGFRARWSSSSTETFPYIPVLLFINKRSGGQVGEKIYRQLLPKLNPRQVFLLENNATITHALETYAAMPNIRICVFGGDGTVGWTLGRLAETYPSGENPPVSICPLGTGNDLSRVLSWGEQYDPRQLFDVLLQTVQAQVVKLDRWQVQLNPLDPSVLASPVEQSRGNRFQLFSNHPKFVYETNRNSYPSHHEVPNARFINYMSFGLDAAITLDFHDQRTRNPSKFSSPLKNKLMYINESCKYFNDVARAYLWDLRPYLRLICDGQDLTDAMRDCHTLVALNIPGYASGTNPWGMPSTTVSVMQDNVLTDAYETWKASTISSDRFEPQDFGDRKIEVVGLSTTHMAAIHIGFRGKRIAHCRQLRIELSCPMTAQMDGEPFYLPACVAINIDHAGQVLVLKNNPS